MRFNDYVNNQRCCSAINICGQFADLTDNITLCYYFSMIKIEDIQKRLREEIKSSDISQKELAKRLAYYLAEINVLHPFREGNGRTSREFIRQLALLNGYRLNLKEVPTKEIMEAMKLSIVYTEKLENILYKCLEKGVDN